jgi:hypothetical protein
LHRKSAQLIRGAKEIYYPGLPHGLTATEYRTEAEVFGWSFVFWAHIPSSRFSTLVED